MTLTGKEHIIEQVFIYNTKIYLRNYYNNSIVDIHAAYLPQPTREVRTLEVQLGLCRTENPFPHFLDTHVQAQCYNNIDVIYFSFPVPLQHRRRICTSDFKFPVNIVSMIFEGTRLGI